MTLRLLRITLATLAAALLLGPSAARAQYFGDRSTAEATRSTRIYMLRGLGDQLLSSGIDEIGQRIRQRDPRTFIAIDNWYDWEDIPQDAMLHPVDRIVIVGYSLGSKSAGLAANALARSGIDVKVIGIDPLCADAAVDISPHISAVNFYFTSCITGGGRMAGARNVKVGDGRALGLFTVIGHNQFPSLPAVQRVVVDESFRDDFAGARRFARGRAASHARGAASHQSRGRRAAG